MRYCADDKYEIIQLVQNSNLSVRQTLGRLSIHKSTFYNWLNRYQENGIDGHFSLQCAQADLQSIGIGPLQWKKNITYIPR